MKTANVLRLSQGSVELCIDSRVTCSANRARIPDKALEVAFNLTIAEWQGERGKYGCMVTAQALCKALQLSNVGRFRPCQLIIEMAELALARRSELPAVQ